MAIQIEIEEDKLAYLFEQGVLCAADFRCLTSASKHSVSQLCLNNCAKRLKAVPCSISISIYKRTH
jgi:hypothetical protein